MNMEESKQLEMVCHMLEVQYEKSRGRVIFSKELDNNDLYPRTWFSNKDYLKKAKVLAEAIEKGCLITETTEYLDVVGCVKIDNDEEER